MEKYFYKYLPIGIVLISLIFQYNLFVTPEKLEVKHREILSDVAHTYSTKEQYNDLKEQDILINTGIFTDFCLIFTVAVLSYHSSVLYII